MTLIVANSRCHHPPFALSLGVGLEAHLTPPPQPMSFLCSGHARTSQWDRVGSAPGRPCRICVRCFPRRSFCGSGKFHKTWSRKRQQSSFTDRKDETMGTNITVMSQRVVPAPLNGISTPMLLANISAVGVQPELAKRFAFTASNH
jgi:hypothetical protein